MDLVDVANDKEIQEITTTLESCHSLDLGKNYFEFKAPDAESTLQLFVSDLGEIVDHSVLPSKIVIDYDDATACLESQITISVSYLGQLSSCF